MKGKGRIVILMSVFVLFLTGFALAEEKCPLCGMNIAGNENTAFVIEKNSGETITYCCPHCGLWVVSQEGKDIKSAKSRDMISGEWLDASKAVYLFGSKATPACTPSWLSFGDKAEAEMFQKGFGGTILIYEEALKKRASMPQGMEEAKGSEKKEENPKK